MHREGATTPPLTRLRRLALQQQGLLGRRPFGRGHDGTLRAIQRLGYVQIDTISVVNRAHDHVLQSRVPDYRGSHLEALQQERLIFEYWSHAAAYLPMADYRYALPKMRAMSRGEDRWIRCRDGKLMSRVLDRVRAEGPLQARDFAGPSSASQGGWWHWKPAKQALEQLFMEGRLMVSGRRGFQKVYDLPERVLPADVDTSEPSQTEHAGYLIRRSLQAHGFASAANMTYLRRDAALQQTVRELLERLRQRGELTAFALPGSGRGQRFYAEPDILERRAPTAPAIARVLSPFDNAVIQRQRNQTVFQFDYQLECYLPTHKRRYGYFCLPLLYRDRFIGRADCKAHRQPGAEQSGFSPGVMEIRALFVEDERPLIREPDRCLAALAEALTDFSRSNGCADTRLGRIEPRRWRDPLIRAFAASNRTATEGEPP